MHTLERLYLSKNQLKEISRSITELSHITVLDLSSNQIQTLPPTNSWTGTRLNKLNLSHNQLVLLTHKPDSSAPSPPQRISEWLCVHDGCVLNTHTQITSLHVLY